MSACAGSPTRDGWFHLIMLKLDRFRKTGLFCDTELQSLDGRHLYAQSSILAASCPILYQQLYKSKPGVYAVEVPLTTAVLECILNFIYTGKWDLTLMEGVELVELDRGVAVMGLHNSGGLGAHEGKTGTRPQRCLYGKPLCKKRRKGDASDGDRKHHPLKEEGDDAVWKCYSVNTSSAGTSRSSTRRKIGTEAFPIDCENSEGSDDSSDKISRPTIAIKGSRNGFKSTTSHDKIMNDFEPREKLKQRARSSSVRSLEVQRTLPQQRHCSKSAAVSKEKHLHDDPLTFRRHVKFTAPLHNRGSDAQESESVPPPLVSAQSAHGGAVPALSSTGRRQGPRKLLKLKRESKLTGERKTNSSSILMSHGVETPQGDESNKSANVTRPTARKQPKRDAEKSSTVTSGELPPSAKLSRSVMVLNHVDRLYPGLVKKPDCPSSDDEGYSSRKEKTVNGRKEGKKFNVTADKNTRKQANCTPADLSSSLCNGGTDYPGGDPASPARRKRVPKRKRKVRKTDDKQAGHKSGDSDKDSDSNASSSSSSSTSSSSSSTSSSSSSSSSSSDSGSSDGSSSESEVGSDSHGECVSAAKKDEASSDPDPDSEKCSKSPKEVLSPKGTEMRPEGACCTSSKARIKASQTGIKFLRREILHKWILDEDTKDVQWYQGKVMSIVSGTDGSTGAVYQVDYKGEGVYDVDHLLEDYLEGSLSIIS